MPEYADIYIISEKRDRAAVEGFLGRFLRRRAESADDYPVPQYSENPEIVFERAADLIDYCDANRGTVQSIYWRALGDSKPEHAMVFYLKDGNVIYGLSTDASDQNYAKNLLKDLKDHFNAEHGFIAHEAAPDAEDHAEFLAQEKVYKP